MSPHDINVLLHHYCRADDWPQGLTDAYQGSLNWMFRNGLCNKDSTLTSKGKALVRMLCDTPLPEQRFINPLTGEALEDAA